MKRTERRHLKDNELASLAATARQTLEERRGQLTAVLVVVILIGGVAIGYFAWRGSMESSSRDGR